MTDESLRVDRILAKAEYVEESLDVLVDHRSVSREEYVASRERKDIVERRFETMTQACLDIAQILLVDLDVEVPETNPATITALIDQGVLTDETGRQMAEASSFRNVLAHQYGRVIDDEMVHEALQDLDRYRDFLVEVRDFLAERGEI